MTNLNSQRVIKKIKIVYIRIWILYAMNNMYTVWTFVLKQQAGKIKIILENFKLVNALEILKYVFSSVFLQYFIAAFITKSEY